MSTGMMSYYSITVVLNLFEENTFDYVKNLRNTKINDPKNK